MKRMLACLALLAPALCMPALAERLYVPVVGAPDGAPATTSVWVASARAEAPPIQARFLGAERAAARTFAVEPGIHPLAGLVPARGEGLVAVDADEATLSAWMEQDPDADPVEVPVIGPHDSYAPGAQPVLALQGDGALRIAVANVDDTPALCTASLTDADGSDRGEISFTVGARGLAHRDLDAARRAGVVAARVSCDRQFFPLAVDTGGDLQVAIAKSSGANGACNRWLALTRQSDGSYAAAIGGVFHQGTTAHPKGILCIKSPGRIAARRAVYDWDVVVGPWWKKKPSGIHNLGYFFGERYRSGVIGNVNATGTKGGLRVMQNYSMPRGHNSAGGVQYRVQRGALYHARYTYDAGSATATLQLFRNGAEVKRFSIGTSPAGHTLMVTPYGKGASAGLALIAEFGNYDKRGLPEVPTIGWTYANFRLRLDPR